MMLRFHLLVSSFHGRAPWPVFPAIELVVLVRLHTTRAARGAGVRQPDGAQVAEAPVCVGRPRGRAHLLWRAVPQVGPARARSVLRRRAAIGARGRAVRGAAPRDHERRRRRRRRRRSSSSSSSRRRRRRRPRPRGTPPGRGRWRRPRRQRAGRAQMRSTRRGASARRVCESSSGTHDLVCLVRLLSRLPLGVERPQTVRVC